jgi:hypothetical protein
MVQDDKIFCVNRNKRPYFRLVVSLPVFLFILVRSFVSIYNSDHSYRILILQLLAIFIIGACTFLVNAIVYVIDSRPALELNADELVDKISYAKSISINWNTIKSVEIRKFNGSDHLLIFLKDPEHVRVLEKKVGMKRKMLENIAVRTGTPVAINLSLLAIEPEVLIDKIESRIVID